MGIGKSAAHLLMKNLVHYPLSGSRRILTLGRQDIAITMKDLRQLAQHVGLNLVPIDTVELSPRPVHAAAEWISDVTLFRALGFSDVVSLDASGFEGASFTFDLNSVSLPADLRGSFEWVLDPGTMEHVFSVPNVLRNIWSALECGGRAVHISPSSNWIDHGFYMYSPTLFYDFYVQNNWQIQTIQVVRHSQFPGSRWFVVDYSPGCLMPRSSGGLDGHTYQTFCVAQKTEDATGDRVPQQGRYFEEWFDPGNSDKGTRWAKQLVMKNGVATRSAIRLLEVKRWWHKGWDLDPTERC